MYHCQPSQWGKIAASCGFLIALFIGILFGGGLLEAEAAGFSSQTGSGQFRENDTLPSRYRLFQQSQAGAEGIWGLGPGQQLPARSSFKEDAHAGVANYSPRKLCIDCHREQEKDLHRVRMGISCVQCHRDQPIAGIQHYYSAMNPIRRHAYVCAKCHEGATPSFASYLVHEPNPLALATRESFPLHFYATWFMVILAGSVFLFFLPYTAIWWLREWLEQLLSGRSKPKAQPKATKRLRRFTPALRFWHLVLVVIFMIMAVTGVAWMYMESSWGQGIAAWFGGAKNTLELHRMAGLLLLALFGGHIVWLFSKINWLNLRESLFGPDSIIFLWRDLLDFFQHMGWVFGVAKKPAFERWSWWEKFDYWAVWWGFVIVGLSGLMLYDPVLTSDYFPGWFINVVLWVHRIESILAMGHIFTVHFIVEHWRPHLFPFNDSIFDGGLALDDARESHPKWVERLEQDGRLASELSPQPPVWLRLLYFGFGYAIMAMGIFLLVFGLLNATLVTLF